MIARASRPVFRSPTRASANRPVFGRRLDYATLPPRPLPGRGWAAFGVEGLAPYFIKVAATAYASDAGHLAAKVTASWEASLTQRLIIEPQIELNAYSRPDAARDVAAGVSDIDAGIRLRYEVRRKFAPYAGIAYERRLGPVPRLNAVRAAAGLRVWL